MRDKTKQSLYNTWANIIQRCTNQNRPDYKNYGGRGISVCERWRTSFKAFAQDMGERPPFRSIDRINNDGNYEPSNCRWATKSQQALNTRRDMMKAVMALNEKRRARTHCKNGHEFTPENTYRYKNTRTCKICRAAWDRFLYYDKKRPIEEFLYPIGKPGRKPQTHCKRGHEFTLENTFLDDNGHKNCCACRTARNKKTRTGAGLCRCDGN